MNILKNMMKFEGSMRVLYLNRHCTPFLTVLHVRIGILTEDVLTSNKSWCFSVKVSEIFYSDTCPV